MRIWSEFGFVIPTCLADLFFVILTLNKRKYLKFCHTERSEVSTNLTQNYLWIATQILQKFVRNDKKAFSLNLSFSVQVQISLEVSASRAVA